MNSSAITLSSQSLQNAIAQLHREGIPKEEILAVLPDILPPEICQVLELQLALLFQCPSSINETFLFNLLFDCFTRGLEPPEILKICSVYCTRSDYAFCLIALDYIETNYQPSAYEFKALKHQLYQEYLAGTPSIELAQKAESIKNIYYKHLYYRTADLLSEQEQIEENQSAIASPDVQLNSSLDDYQLDVAKSLSSKKSINQLGEYLVELLKTFDINCSLVGISNGPAFNRFKLRMGVNTVRLSQKPDKLRVITQAY